MAAPAFADLPAGSASAPAYRNAQERKLVEDARRALKAGNLSLATIQLRNALLQDRDNPALHVQLGVVLYQGGDLAGAESELRQAQLSGSDDPDLIPTLLQVMALRRESKDLLTQFPEPGLGDTSKLAAVILQARTLALLDIGDANAAEAAIERALSILADNRGLMIRAQVARRQSQPDVALSYIDKALVRDRNDLDALMMKAELLRKNKPAEALAIVETALKSHPQAINPQMTRIEILIETKRFDEAAKADDAVLKQLPNFPLAAYYKALMVSRTQGAKEGWRIAQSLPSPFIQSEDRIALGAAQLAADSGNLESANTILSTYLGQHAAALEVRVRLAELYLEMKVPGDALEVLKPLFNTNNAGVLELIARTYERLGQRDNAVAYLRKSSDAGSNFTTYRLAISDIMNGNVPRGMQEYEAAVKRGPVNMSFAISAVTMLLLLNHAGDANSVADLMDEVAPRDPAPPYLHAKILYAQNDRAGSMVALNTSLSRDAKYYPALFSRSQLFILQGNYAAALVDLRRAQSVRPDDSENFVKLAQIAQLQKQPDKAIAFFRQAIAKAPKLARYRIDLAQYQVNLKQYRQAESTLKEALAALPAADDCLSALGQLQLFEREYKDAVATYRFRAQKNPKSAPAQITLARALTAAGDKAGALSALRQAVRIVPGDLQYRTVLIESQISAGDGNGAVATAQDWAKTRKGPEGPLLVARTLAQLNRLPEAGAVLSAVPPGQQNFETVLLSSQLALRSGDKAKALWMLKSWVLGHGDDFVAHQAYGDLLAQTGDKAGALGQYELILREKGNNARILNNIAYLVMDKTPDRALDLASKAAHLAPNAPDIADTLGWIMLRKGDARGAVPVLQRAHTGAPGSGDVSYHLAAALSAVGQKADAKKILQAAIARDPKFSSAPDANKLLQTL